MLITGSRSSDMERTLEEAAKARQTGIGIIVIGVSPWVNVVELAGVASYPYESTRLLLPGGYGSLPSIKNQLRDMICNSKLQLGFALILSCTSSGLFANQDSQTVERKDAMATIKGNCFYLPSITYFSWSPSVR